MRVISAIAEDSQPSSTRNVAIVAYDGVEVIDLTGPLDVLGMTNGALSCSGAPNCPPPYATRVLARQPGLVTTSCGLRIQADTAYADIQEDIDTLIIPGAPDVTRLLADRALRDWVLAISGRVRRLVSVCTGAFLLAEIGLLNGRCATTHWAYAARLSADYPAVRVEADRIYLRDGPILTSGGITSGIDLTLALVEEDLGREVALLTARYLVMFLKRPGGQTQFSGFLASEATHHPDVRALQLWILEHPAEDLRLEALAERMAMSPRNFSRVFLAETGTTPAKFVEKARIDAARQWLGEPGIRVEEAAALAGFSDPERMRRAFLRHIGINPQDYRDRFGPADPLSPPVMTESVMAAIQSSINAFDAPEERQFGEAHGLPDTG